MKKYLAYLPVFVAAIVCANSQDSVGQTATPGTCYATVAGAASGIDYGIATIDLATAVASVTALTTDDPLAGLAVNSSGELYATEIFTSTLYSIDPSGTATAVANVEDGDGHAFYLIAGIAFDESDVLYGVGFRELLADPVLFTINTTTAVGTIVGTTTYAYAGLAFDPDDGTLFASAGALDDAGLIATIDKTSGADPPVGYTGYSKSTTDLAFDASGNLFGLVGGGGDPQNLLVAINKATGLAAEVDTVQESSVNITHLSGFICYNPDAGGGDDPEPVLVDVKPGACPNQLNSNAKSTVNVAILGTADLDVTTINVGSLSLEGLTPYKWSYADVSRPPADGGDCPCTDEGPDGFVDLQLKFKNQVILSTLGEFADGENFTLHLEGVLNDETEIAGDDCIVVQEPNDNYDESVAKGADIETVPESYVLEQNYPNPFNPTTSIGFSLPVESHVLLTVYNAVGQRVATLVSGTLPAGRHSVPWNATNDSGRSLSSGLYIYRLSAGEFVKTQKMLLLE